MIAYLSEDEVLGAIMGLEAWASSGPGFRSCRRPASSGLSSTMVLVLKSMEIDLNSWG